MSALTNAGELLRIDIVSCFDSLSVQKKSLHSLGFRRRLASLADSHDQGKCENLGMCATNILWSQCYDRSITMIVMWSQVTTVNKKKAASILNAKITSKWGKTRSMVTTRASAENFRRCASSLWHVQTKSLTTIVQMDRQSIAIRYAYD